MSQVDIIISSIGSNRVCKSIYLACSLFTAIDLYVYSLVDLCFFYRLQCLHTLDWECAAVRCH